jgi:hypothetical protein
VFTPSAETERPAESAAAPVGKPFVPPAASGLPAQVGRFRVRAEVGCGAFGRVLRAYDPELDREVALKVPHQGLLANDKTKERFLREARAAGKLRHPNIVPVYEAGHDGTHYYIAAAFIEGQTLADRLAAGPLDFRRAAQVVQELAEALAYAHGQGVIHRDVKPVNVLLDGAGKPHLADFGLAYRHDVLTRLTQEGALLGTAAYMAPEQAGGQSGEPLPATDQYSLGVVLYELLCGRVPFTGPIGFVIASHISRKPEPPGRVQPGIPAALQAICLKAMAKRPEHRYGSCQEMADDLRRWREGAPVAARRPNPVEQALRWCRRRPELTVTGLAAAAFLFVFLVLFLNWPAAPPEEEPVATAANPAGPPPQSKATPAQPQGDKGATAQASKDSPAPAGKGKGPAPQGGADQAPGKQRGPGVGPGVKGAGKSKPPPGDPPLAPPSTVERVAGNYVAAKSGPSLLLQQPAPGGAWRVLDATQPAVLTARPLVSLPGCRGSVRLKSGLGVTLWGALPGEVLFLPALLDTFQAHLEESRVLLHDNPGLDADLTLQRGRILLDNPLKRPLRARIRFDNPTNPELPEAWDVTLEDPGTEVLVDLWHFYGRDEPFFPDPKDSRRQGPVAAGHLIVRQGAVSLRRNDQTLRMEADPPKAALIAWNSVKGTGERMALPGVPDWASDKPGELPKGLDAKLRDSILKARGELARARDTLVTALGGGGDKVDVALASILKNSPNKAEHVLAVRAYGALDDLPDLVDALGNEVRPEVREAAVEALRGWIADARDNDYRLLDELKTRYSRVESENILQLLHSFSAQQASQPELYDFLMLNLNNPRIALRELAAWHLYRLAPQAGGKIPYTADAPGARRRAAQEQWNQLLQRGQLPEGKAAPIAAPPGDVAPGKGGPEQKALRRIVNMAAPGDVVSGKAANVLLADLAKHAGKKTSAGSEPLDEDVLKHINITRPAGGNLGLLRNDGRIPWPALLRAERERTEIDQMAKSLFEQGVEKRLDANLLRDLKVRVQRLQFVLGARVPGIPSGQYVEARRFLTDLQSAVRALAEGLAPVHAEWRRFARNGKTAREVADWLNTHGLVIAPAVPGDEAAYQALYTALAGHAAAVHAQAAGKQ